VPELEEGTIGNLLNCGETDKQVGALLGVLVGDVLGAGVEGLIFKTFVDFNASGTGESALGIAKSFPNGPRDFIFAPHMGIEYRGSLYGRYTDDTQTSIGLAASLVSCQGLNPLHAARSYAGIHQRSNDANSIPYR
jgi:ADP-ribosylglycohydrolase